MLQKEVMNRTAQLVHYGHRVIHEIALAALPRNVKETRETFGFIDGISQPIIRGTRREVGRGNHPRISRNLGYVAPMPTSDGFPIGPNGTFLVARQLEQDPDRFKRYLDAAAPVVAADPRSPSKNPVWIREWIAAKMVGRWRADDTKRTLLTQYQSQSF
jgi:deferrochelatase/peroxidase EfeB